MLTSIMMVTYNRLNLTKQTIKSLLENTKNDFELIVIDNKSSDDTVNYLYEELGNNIHTNKFMKSFKIIKNDINKGIAYGRNQCLEVATGDYLSTIDNDILFPENWLEQCINILQLNSDYGMVGINYETNDKNENIIYPIINKDNLEWQNKPKGNLGTATTVFHNSLHKLLGFFNLEYGILYGLDDSDFGMRVRCAGLKLGYIKTNGVHLGIKENDTGKYREFKTQQHNSGLKQFNQNCAAYANKRKSLYIPFKK